MITLGWEISQIRDGFRWYYDGQRFQKSRDNAIRYRTKSALTRALNAVQEIYGLCEVIEVTI